MNPKEVLVFHTRSPSVSVWLFAYLYLSVELRGTSLSTEKPTFNAV